MINPFAYKFEKNPDISYLVGTRYKLPNGKILELVGYNDLNVPYFGRITRGKLSKKKYTCAYLEADITAEALAHNKEVEDGGVGGLKIRYKLQRKLLHCGQGLLKPPTGSSSQKNKKKKANKGRYKI